MVAYLKIWGLEQSFSQWVCELYQIPAAETRQPATQSLSAKAATNQPTNQPTKRNDNQRAETSQTVNTNGASKSLDLLNMFLSSDQVDPNFRAVLKVFLLTTKETLTFYKFQSWTVSKQEGTRNMYMKENIAKSLQAENQSLE